MKSGRESIIKLKNQFMITNQQLSLILGVSMLRIEAILKGADVTRYEHVKLGRALKIKKMIEKPMSINEIINEQHNTINGTKDRIMDIAHHHIQTKRCEEITNYIDDMIVEAMYLGMLHANNNDDEIVLKKVREIRRR